MRGSLLTNCPCNISITSNYPQICCLIREWVAWIMHCCRCLWGKYHCEKIVRMYDCTAKLAIIASHGTYKFIIISKIVCSIKLIHIAYATHQVRLEHAIGVNIIVFIVFLIINSHNLSFGCPIIYTDIIHYAIMFIDTSTIFDTTKLIL